MRKIVCILFAAGLLFWSCNNYSYGQLSYGPFIGADMTNTYYPGDSVFEERLAFLSGVWYSHYAGIGRLDGYRIREWSSLSAQDKVKAQALFPGIDINNPLTYFTQDAPKNGDYVFLYDDTVYGQQDDGSSATDGSWGFSYMGVVRAINIFNGDIKRGVIIIEYFEEADPEWLWDVAGYSYQGLGRGEKP